MVNNSLRHSGTKGMKWGVRRYQNEDGTLTELGKKRYARDTKNMSEKKKKKYETDPDKWVREDISRTKGVVDASSNMANQLKSAAGNLPNGKRAKLDLSKMTDQQMRNEINRAMLERQYNDIFAPQKANKGKEVVQGILNTVGTVLGIGSSALGIALAIKELKG